MRDPASVGHAQVHTTQKAFLNIRYSFNTKILLKSPTMDGRFCAVPPKTEKMISAAAVEIKSKG